MAARNEPNILAALEEHGTRMTWPRRHLAALVASQSEPFSAEDIVADVPSLGRATIYRTLRLLVQAGILCKTVMPNGSQRYSLDDVDHHHHHLVCVSCGRIDAFHHPAIERALRVVKKELAGGLIGHRLELYHRCSACQASSEGLK